MSRSAPPPLISRRLWVALAAAAVFACEAAGDGAGGAGGTPVSPTGDATAPGPDGGQAGGDAMGGDAAAPTADAGPTPTCQEDCSDEGARTCQGDVPAVCGDADDDGCLEWTPEPACAAGLVCADGECTATCGATDCTTEGARDCDGDAVVVCGDHDADGCLEWSAPEACAAGQVCTAGRCAVGCTDECNVVGARRCEGNATVTCDDHDANGCLEWGAAAECGDGLSCSAGRCAAQCQNECSAAGAHACDPGGVRTCDDFDADGCLELGDPVPCPDGQTCSNGLCAVDCQNECAAEGATRCELDDVVACGQFDADACLEWGTPAQCGGGQICADGQCAASCRDECPVDAQRQCNEAGAVITCGDFDTDDCLEWGTPEACQDGQTCSGGVCALQCQNECGPADEWRCVAGTVDQRQQCGEHDGDGCLEWGSAVTCDGALVCSGGDCVESCRDECDDGAVHCAGDAGGVGGVETCGDHNDDGCVEWGPTMPCDATQVCVEGACQERPLPAVVISELLYDSAGADTDTFVELHGPAGTNLDGLTLVGLNGNGGALYNSIRLTGVVPADGLYVVAHTGATAGLRDVADQLDDKVDFQNGPDSVQLRLGDRVVDAVGYGDFAGAIFGGEGTPAADGPAASSLARNAAYADTGDNGADFRLQDTPTPGLPNDATPECTGHADQVCFDGNLWWVDSCGDREAQAQACPNGCQDRACVPCVDPCPAEGDVLCQNGALRTCAPVGACLQWGAGAPCATGACADADSCQDVVDLVVGASRELCGRHDVGRFVVQGGATITCPAGDLEIHAREIFIDPSSAIDLSAVSEEVSGSRHTFCTDGHLNEAASGGGGGGNGTAGQAAPATRWEMEVWEPGCSGGSQCYDVFCRDCGGAAGGGVRDADTNSLLSKGGRGGDGCEDWTSASPGSYSHVCDPAELPVRGGRGGGIVRLFATQRIDVLGSVRARGENGRINAAVPMSGSGGGAGGSVMLPAPVVAVSGTVDVSGGTGYARATNEGCGATTSSGGNGGNGRLKVLYGQRFDNNGTVSGATVSASYMPPEGFRIAVDDVAAARQPAVVTDSFQAVEIAWDAPFAEAQGFWYRLDQNPAGAVTPANGTYTTETSVRLARAVFTAPGTWYFHVVSVHAPTVTTGTVSSAAVLQLNHGPLVLSCESHPDQNAWNPGQAVMLRWAAPQGYALADYERFHYRVDRRSNTTYTGAAGWTTTANANVLLDRDAAGAPLDRFAYYIHVVGEDHFGNVGSAVAHWRVLIGPEPARTNFFGYVRNAAGQPLEGVTLRLEPFGLTQRTVQSGYFLFENMYVGTYDALVEGAGGYERVGVVVNAGASPFTVTPP